MGHKISRGENNGLNETYRNLGRRVNDARTRVNEFREDYGSLFLIYFLGEDVITRERIRNHLRDNRNTYMTGGACLLVGSGFGLFCGIRGEGVNTKAVQILTYKSKQVLEVYVEALGDPGNIIQDIKTGTIYASQGQAARELGLSVSEISKHLKGRNPHVKGHIFKKLGKASVSEV